MKYWIFDNENMPVEFQYTLLTAEKEVYQFDKYGEGEFIGDNWNIINFLDKVENNPNYVGKLINIENLNEKCKKYVKERI